MIFGNSVREIEKMMDMIERKTAKIGMSVNKNKCNVLVFNKKLDVGSIKGINVVKDVKYLGVKLSSGRDVFREHREDVKTKARKMSNMTYSVIYKACNKVPTNWEDILEECSDAWFVVRK